MNSIPQTKIDANQSKHVFLLISLILVALIGAIVSSQTSIRKILADDNQNKIILAKVIMKTEKYDYVILKNKVSNGIEIDIYKLDLKTNIQIFLQKFSLNQDSNALLMVGNDHNAISLADVNKDGLQDIVVPSVDQYGNSRLNTFIFNQSLEQFQPYSEE